MNRDAASDAFEAEFAGVLDAHRDLSMDDALAVTMALRPNDEVWCAVVSEAWTSLSSAQCVSQRLSSRARRRRAKRRRRSSRGRAPPSLSSPIPGSRGEADGAHDAPPARDRRLRLLPSSFSLIKAWAVDEMERRRRCGS